MHVLWLSINSNHITYVVRQNRQHAEAIQIRRKGQICSGKPFLVNFKLKNQLNNLCDFSCGAGGDRSVKTNLVPHLGTRRKIMLPFFQQFDSMFFNRMPQQPNLGTQL